MACGYYAHNGRCLHQSFVAIGCSSYTLANSARFLFICRSAIYVHVSWYRIFAEKYSQKNRKSRDAEIDMNINLKKQV